MITNNTSTTTRQDFASVRDSYYRAHEAIVKLADDVNYQASKSDPIDDAYIAALRAMWKAKSPDFAAVMDKLHIVLRNGDSSGESTDAIKSIMADLSSLTGQPKFNAAAWLSAWVDYDGGYVVQDGTAKLLCPAGTANATRERLLQELDDMNGREALDTYILSWVADEAQDQPPADFDTLKQAVTDAYAKANDRNNTEAEANTETDALNTALQNLMAYPATSGAQLAYKLKMFRDLECDEYVEEIRDPMLDAFEADARRIGGAA
jgi:hypothetical protein